MGSTARAAAASGRSICVSGLTSYSSTKSNTSSANACSDTSYTDTWYHDGSGSTPVNGDTVYTDISGCTVLNGGGQWYSDSVGFLSYQISSSGVVSNQDICT